MRRAESRLEKGCTHVSRKRDLMLCLSTNCLVSQPVHNLKNHQDQPNREGSCRIVSRLAFAPLKSGLLFCTTVEICSHNFNNNNNNNGMTQTPLAIAQYAPQDTRSNLNRSAYNHNDADEPDIVVPTASAHVLPASGESSPISSSNNNNAVNTSAVATVYKPEKKPTTSPATTTTTTTTTTTITTIPASHPQAQQAVVVARRLARMKENRKARQAVAATTGAVAGLIVLGPVGAVIGGIAMHSAVKTSGRAAERRVCNHYFPNHHHHRTTTTRTTTAVATPVDAAAAAAVAGRQPTRRNHVRHNQQGTEY